MMIFLILCIFDLSLLQASSNSMYNESLYVQPTPIVQLQFPYSINTDYVRTSITGLSTSGSGSVTQSGGMAVLSTNTTAGSAAVLASINVLPYKPGEGVVNFFSAVFGPPDANNVEYIGVGNASDGFFFGYNGTTFGILYRTSVSGSVIDTWTAQTSWNIDPMDGTGPSGITLNPEFGNIYKIQYHWLGFGLVKFYVQSPQDGTFILVHTINFLNTESSPMISNGSMQLLAVSQNSPTGNTNVALSTSSMMGAVQGKVSIANNTRFSFYSNGTTNGTNIRNIFTMLNNTVYPNASTTPNQVMIYPDFLTFYNTSSTNDFVIYLIVNPSGATPATVLSANSVVLYDNSAINLTPGTIIWSKPVNGGQNGYLVNLADLGICLAPGQSLSVAVARIGAGNVTVYASLSWTEGC